MRQYEAVIQVMRENEEFKDRLPAGMFPEKNKKEESKGDSSFTRSNRFGTMRF